MKTEDKPQFKVQMEAIGTVTNPDGTTKQIILRAERPLTDEELAHDDYSLGGGRDRGD